MYVDLILENALCAVPREASPKGAAQAFIGHPRRPHHPWQGASQRTMGEYCESMTERTLGDDEPTVEGEQRHYTNRINLMVGY
jgi:hypothetical protein